MGVGFLPLEDPIILRFFALVHALSPSIDRPDAAITIVIAPAQPSQGTKTKARRQPKWGDDEMDSVTGPARRCPLYSVLGHALTPRTMAD